VEYCWNEVPVCTPVAARGCAVEARREYPMGECEREVSRHFE
jgi:hypothetical protein